MIGLTHRHRLILRRFDSKSTNVRKIGVRVDLSRPPLLCEGVPLRPLKF